MGAHPPTLPPRSAPAPRHRVLIVDDHPVVRAGLRHLNDLEPDLIVCGEADSERDARAAIRELKPDAVIVDLALAHGDGLELVRNARAQHPHLPLLVLSVHDEMIYAERLLAAGASGYVMKRAASEELLLALRRVLGGGSYVSERVAASLQRAGRAARGHGAASADPIQRLTNRELQVLTLIGRGKSSREAAGALGLSVKTVESHRQNLKRKLNLHNNAQLLHFCVNWCGSRGA